VVLSHNKREGSVAPTLIKGEPYTSKESPSQQTRRSLRGRTSDQKRESTKEAVPQDNSQAEVAAENKTMRGEQVNVIMREGWVLIYSLGGVRIRFK
jgi:hypothetical protein